MLSAIQTKPTKYDYIDILRGIGILGVIAVHTPQYIRNLPSAYKEAFNFGQLGVQMFFVASAITLCLSMASRNEATPLNFYIRRFFRIAPLYYIAIVLYFLWRPLKIQLLGGSSSIDDGYSLLAILENIFFVHGFDWKNFNFVVPGGWSIATEMMFYLIFPLLFAAQLRFGLRRFLFFSIILTACSFVIQYALTRYTEPYLVKLGIISTLNGNDNFGFIYATIANQLPVFLVGIVTYMLLGRAIPNWLLLVAIGLVFIGVLLQNPLPFDTGFNGFWFPTISAIAFGIFALKLANAGKFKSRFAGALVRIGRLSFSIYILHFFVLDLLALISKKSLFTIGLKPEIELFILYSVATLTTYHLAKLTNKYIEKPGVAFGKRITASNLGSP